MRRTLSLRIYPTSGYSTPLQPNGSNNAVRLLYAIAAGDNFSAGAVVPGDEFAHISDGVWERSINTSIVNPYRTDYYYVQYTINGGTSWINVNGYDPFYFNTRLIGYSQDTITPTIASLTPETPTVAGNAITAIITTTGLYTNTDTINPSHIREYSYMFSPDPLPSTYTWTISNMMDNQVSIPRVGTGTGKNNYVHSRYRVYNPVSGEYSAYSAVGHSSQLGDSFSELVESGSGLSDPSFMTADYVKEIGIWGENDGLSVLMPYTTRGVHSELAVQYGNATTPTISGGELVNFSGIIIQATDTMLSIRKPLSMMERQTAFFARRVVGYDTASNWVGSSAAALLEVDVYSTDKNTLLSPDVLNAVADALAGKFETADGKTIGRKPSV